MINQHQHNIDFTTLAALSFLSPFLKKAIAAYETVQDKLNELFSHLYVTHLGNSDFPLASTTAKKMLDHAIKELSANKNVAFLFLDALRNDIAVELKARIDNMMEKNKRSFSSSKVTPKQAYSLLPSTTGVGWPSILAHDLQVEYVIKPQNEKFKVEINLTDGSNSIHQYSPNDRNKRLLAILIESQQQLKLFELDTSNVQKSVTSYRKKALSTKNHSLIPVLWYNKFDDHDQDRYEFYASLDSSLDQLVQLVYQLHVIGIDHVYMFTDHGFTFSKNSQKLKDIPKEEVQSRYCYSVTEFTDIEKEKFNEWYFWYPGQISGVSSSDNNLMIITPKLNGIFKKIRQKERFVHGGLTFQECDIQFLQSTGVLIPKVTIASIEYVKHQIEINYAKQEVIILKEGKADKFLEIKVHATQTSLHAPSLQPIRIRIIADVGNTIVKPAGDKPLKAGGTVSFKLYFSDFVIENQVIITILDQINEALKIEKVIIKSPVYDIGF